MPFSVKAYIGDHVLTCAAEAAKEAFAKAFVWRVVNNSRLSIRDGIKTYSIAEFSSVIASFPT
ncbi:MAG: hypothetical protein K2X57_02045 [Xanthobacteraceae bacterium]|nr:hypothetical protein [Xanthobacteraceae bacterium]